MHYKQEDIRFRESLLPFGLESLVFPFVLCMYPGACLNMIVISVLNKTQSRRATSATGRNTDYRSKRTIGKQNSFHRIPGFVAIIMNAYILTYLLTYSMEQSPS